MTYRLDVESLSVESFDTGAAPMPAPQADPNDPFAPVVWTGCDSACTKCGGGTDDPTIGGTTVIADPGF